MCGILGRLNNLEYDIFQNALNLQSHRGPDFSGFYKDDYVYLGHNRLSIIDTSSNGNQPFYLEGFESVLVFNGEIYNHNELRKLYLNGFDRYKSHSDTETLYLLLNYYSIDFVLSKIKGMYSFCFYNREVKRLFLARDRFGEKPLHYSLIDDDFLFASELKSIKGLIPTLEISRNSIGNFLLNGHLNGAQTIYTNVKKLLPGHYAIYDIKKRDFEIHQYFTPLNYSNEKFGMTYTDKRNKLSEVLYSTVQEMLIADVEIGSFLSGGIDSSLISLIASDILDKRLSTFSIGFNEIDYNEAVFASKVAKQIGSNHSEYYIDFEDFYSIFYQLPMLYDEPFGDSSAVPSLLLSKKVSNHVKVVLTGDGADEIFGGYKRYFSKRAKLYSLINMFTPNTLKSVFRLYDYSLEKNSRKLLNYDFESNNHFKNEFNGNYFNFMRYHDQVNYLPNDILTKVDRASMKYSIETRAPFLHPDIFYVSMIFKRTELKYSNEIGKKPLVEILLNRLPRELVLRPKKGFSIPIDKWLRNELNSDLDEILNPSKIKSQGLLNYDYIHNCRLQHKLGKNKSDQLWNILMFQLWYDYQKSI